MPAKYLSKDRPDFSKMSGKEKLKWFFYYYKWLLILAAAVVFVIVFTVLTNPPRKEAVLNMVAVNGEPLDPDSQVWDAFLTARGFDPEKQEVTLNTNLSYSGGSGVMDVYSVPSMATILNAGGADVFLSDEACFEALGSLGAFTPMDELFPGEEAEAYKDRFVYVEMDPDADPYILDEETPVDGKYARGIRLDPDCLLYDTGIYPEGEEIIVTLPLSAEHALLAKDMIMDLLE